MAGLKLADKAIVRCNSSAHFITQTFFWGHQLNEAAKKKICFKVLCKSLLWLKTKYCVTDHKRPPTSSHEAPRAASLCWRQGNNYSQMLFDCFRSQSHFRRLITLASYRCLIFHLYPCIPGSSPSLPYRSFPLQEKREFECKEWSISWLHHAQRFCLVLCPASEHWYIP